MTKQDDFKCLMVGLPKTGKSTFLAALWRVVRSSEVSGSMKLIRREGSQAYLNQIEAKWSKCEQLERTPGEGESGISLLLSHPTNGSNVKLEIPDTSGEMYQSHWEFRQCSEAFGTLARECDGCLLFVHPERLVESNFLVDANAIYDDWAEGDEAESGENEAEDEDNTEVTPWEAKNAPTQVQLIEVLQDLVEISNRKLKIAIVVSAWDLETEGLAPLEWIKQRVPMLWQYLQSNPKLFKYDAFGVSAQGGADDAAAQLLEHHIASARIKVQDASYTGNDISMPIQWLISPTTHDGSVE